MKRSTLNGSKRGIASNTAVHELLECPICLNIMYPPIYQCLNGHTLCSKCQPKVRCYPIWRQELGNIRCLALERVAESLKLPCIYQVLGCQDISPYQGRLRHEQNCLFRPYSCPYAGSECPITGDIPFLVGHLRTDHKVDMHDGCTFNHRYVKSNPQDVENAMWMLTVFKCYGYQFCLHFEAFHLGTAPVYLAFIRFIGDDHDAKKFTYTLEFGRKLTWQGIRRYVITDSLDMLIIQRSRTIFFSGRKQVAKQGYLFLGKKTSGRTYRKDEL